MTGQATNPLMLAAPKKRAGKVTLEMLEEMVASLNKARFVRDSGKPYFIGRRVEDEKVVHFLDRKL